MKFDKLGWIVASMLFGGMISMGFQATTQKFGNIDMEKVFIEADVTKKNNETLQAAKRDRQRVLQFLSENLTMLPTDADKFAVAQLKSPQTQADKNEIDRIQAEAVASNAKQRDLSTKSNPTPDELKMLSEFTNRANQNRQILSRLNDLYTADLSETQTKLRTDSLDKVKKAIRDVANKEGYTIIFSQEAAPFAANDLTQDVLKSVAKG